MGENLHGFEMENGKVRHIEGSLYCLEKYYQDYLELMSDSKRFIREFEEAGFKELKSKEYIMDAKMSEKDFRRCFVNKPQKSDPPGYRYMIRVIVEKV